MKRDQAWWDRWFIGLAEYMTTASKDPSTKTGAVIVRPDKTIASVGYNGFPRQVNDAFWLYDNREEKYKRIVHCEMNAVLSAREPLNGYTLYTVPFTSCDRCAAHMIQAGIKRHVSPVIPKELEERWSDSIAVTRQLYKEAGVEMVELLAPTLQSCLDQIQDQNKPNIVGTITQSNPIPNGWGMF